MSRLVSCQLAGDPLPRLEHARDEPAELLLADHVDVLRVVGGHQRPLAVGLAAAGRVVVRQAERMAVLVRDHARVLDRRLGVDVVRPDAHAHRDPGVVRGLRRPTRVGPEQRPSLEVVRLVVGDVALLAVRVRVAVLEVGRVRPDVVVAAVELGVAVAAEPGEDHHEEVDDAVLVGVVGVVVDLRVGDRRGVIDGLAGRPAARVDVLQRADAAERADQRRALAVEAVVLRVARELVPAVGDPVAGLVALGRQRGVRERRALQRGLREPILGRAPRRARRRLTRDGALREQLPVGDLLEQVEGRARVVRVVDLARELGRGRRRRVLAVAVVDGDDRERAIAIARRLVAAGRRDHLRPVGAHRLGRAGGVGERGRRGEVLPDDLGVLGERVRARLDDLELDPRSPVRLLSRDGRDGPVDRARSSSRRAPSPSRARP